MSNYSIPFVPHRCPGCGVGPGEMHFVPDQPFKMCPVESAYWDHIDLLEAMGVFISITSAIRWDPDVQGEIAIHCMETMNAARE